MRQGLVNAWVPGSNVFHNNWVKAGCPVTGRELTSPGSGATEPVGPVVFHALFPLIERGGGGSTFPSVPSTGQGVSGSQATEKLTVRVYGGLVHLF